MVLDAEALRRVALVFVGYVVVAAIVTVFAGWAATLFALPPLFGTLLRWGIGLGFPVALLIAWKYPEIGHHGEVP